MTEKKKEATPAGNAPSTSSGITHIAPLASGLTKSAGESFPRTRSGRLRVLRAMIRDRPTPEARMLVIDVMREWGFSRTAVTDYLWSLDLP